MSRNKTEFDLSSIKKGMDMVHKAVTGTIGASGRNVLFRDWSNEPVVTNDGYTIAEMINPEDEGERMGADFMKQASRRQNSEAGDGPQPLHSKILTPTGFINMGNVSVGDTICGTHGTLQRVIGVFPKGDKEVYKVHFSDGRYVECSSEHLWKVKTYEGRDGVLTVKEMMNNGLTRGKENACKYYVPISVASFCDNELPLDPYLVGVLIGDGSLSENGEVEISLGYAKKHILDDVTLPEGLYIKTNDVPSKNSLRIAIRGKTKDGKTIKSILKDIGLLGTYCHNKYIPEIYLHSSIESRYNLLHGLSDTDGHINKKGLLEYSTISKQLCNDIVELLRSLGKTVSSRIHTRKDGDGSFSKKSIYRINELKGYKYGIQIEKIEQTGKSEQMRCIKVSNLDHLYFTDNYVLTHNTSTVVAIAHEMIERGIQKVSEGANAMRIKREMNEAVEAIIPKLKKSAKKITTDKELFDVANLSMENPEMAKIVVDAVNNCGESGRVLAQESNSSETYIEEVKGIEFGRGYISQYMITNGVKLSAELEDCPILIADKEFNLMKQIFPIMEGLKSKGVDKLLIICKNVIGEALGNMIANIQKGTFLCVAVQCDDLDLLEDIAVVTGAQKVNEINTPDCLTPMHVEYLGKVKKAVITRERTLIDSGYGQKDKIDERIKSLKNDIKDKEKDGIYSNKDKARLAQLDGKVVYIRVGAPTQQEMKYTKLKVDDAIASTLAAKKSGVVVGGGRALYDIGRELRISVGISDGDGAVVVAEACQAPMRKIIENARRQPDEILPTLKAGQAWNSLTEKPVMDYMKEGIIDPVDIEIWALKNAVSTAGMYVTTFASLVPIPPKPTYPPPTQ